MVRYVVSKKQKVHVCEMMDLVNEYMQHGNIKENHMEEQYENCRQAFREAVSLYRGDAGNAQFFTGPAAGCRHRVKRIIAKIIARFMSGYIVRQSQLNEKVIDTLAEQQKMLYLMIRSDRKQNHKHAVKEKEC